MQNRRKRPFKFVKTDLSNFMSHRISFLKLDLCLISPLGVNSDLWFFIRVQVHNTKCLQKDSFSKISKSNKYYFLQILRLSGFQIVDELGKELPSDHLMDIKEM